MDWIPLALALIASSVLMYLSTKKLIVERVPSQFQNLGMFFIPSIIFLALGLFQGKDFFSLSPIDFALNILAGAGLSYFGNILSLRAIRDAPNQGYSLSIQKSYAAFTAIASIWLFGSPFSALDGLAIAIIILSAGFVVLGGRKNRAVRADWIPLTIACFFIWGFLALFSTYLVKQGYDVSVLLFWRMGTASLLILGEILQGKTRIEKGILSWKSAPFFLLTGLFAFSFNWSMNLGYLVSPNPGFISAANSGSIALLTLASALVFGDELDKRKLAGVLGVVLGLSILFVF